MKFTRYVYSWLLKLDGSPSGLNKVLAELLKMTGLVSSLM